MVNCFRKLILLFLAVITFQFGQKFYRGMSLLSNMTKFCCMTISLLQTLVKRVWCLRIPFAQEGCENFFSLIPDEYLVLMIVIFLIFGLLQSYAIVSIFMGAEGYSLGFTPLFLDQDLPEDFIVISNMVDSIKKMMWARQ